VKKKYRAVRIPGTATLQRKKRTKRLPAEVAYLKKITDFDI